MCIKFFASLEIIAKINVQKLDIYNEIIGKKLTDRENKMPEKFIIENLWK